MSGLHHYRLFAFPGLARLVFDYGPGKCAPNLIRSVVTDRIPTVRTAGENQLDLLVAWREAPVFSERERAALAWAEGMTHLAEGGVPDEIYAQVSEQFSTKEIADLSFAVAEINAWNRLMVCSRTPAQIAAGEQKAETTK